MQPRNAAAGRIQPNRPGADPALHRRAHHLHQPVLLRLARVSQEGRKMAEVDPGFAGPRYYQYRVAPEIWKFDNFSRADRSEMLGECRVVGVQRNFGAVQQYEFEDLVQARNSNRGRFPAESREGRALQQADKEITKVEVFLPSVYDGRVRHG